MGKKKSRNKKRGKVQPVLTPSQAKAEVPKLRQALIKRNKEVDAMDKALQVLTRKHKEAQKKEADWHREKAELVQKLEQIEVEAAAKVGALEAERAKFAEYKRQHQERQNGELLSQLREMARENKEGWDRERERFSNYKRRTEQQREDASQSGKLNTIKALLSTVDDLEHAIESLPQDIRETSWGNGVELVHRNLVFWLQKHMVEEINPATGDIFDASFHESAVAEESDEHESDRIIETIQKGYRAGDRLLRPALVKVSR